MACRGNCGCPYSGMDSFERFLTAVHDLTALMHKVLTSEGALFSFAALGVLFLVDFARRKCRPNWSREAVTGVLATFTIMVLNIGFAPIAYFATSFAQSAYDTLNVPHLPSEIWSGIPAWLLALIAIVTSDFVNYLNHRAMHHRWLWPIHAIHHSDQHVNGATVFRVHILETAWMQVSYIFLLSWLGLPPGAVGIGAFLLTLHGIYVHMDLDWEHGPFKLLIASPRYHRWHHADVKKAYGKNLANVMPLFDYLFGTYYVPGPCEEKLGAEGVSHDDPIKLMLYPFVEWSAAAARILRKMPGGKPADEAE